MAGLPYARLAEQLRQGGALALAQLEPRQGTDFLSQRPQRQRRRHALALQPFQNPHQAHGISSQHSIGEIKYIIARDIQYRFANLVKIQRAFGEQQPEFLDLLVCRQKIALDTVSQKLQGRRIDTLFLCREPHPDPLRQSWPLYGINRYRRASLLQRFEPFRRLRLLVELGAGHHSDGFIRQPRAIVLQRLAALRARFAGEDANFNDTPGREK